MSCIMIITLPLERSSCHAVSHTPTHHHQNVTAARAKFQLPHLHCFPQQSGRGDGSEEEEAISRPVWPCKEECCKSKVALHTYHVLLRVLEKRIATELWFRYALSVIKLFFPDTDIISSIVARRLSLTAFERDGDDNDSHGGGSDPLTHALTSQLFGAAVSQCNAHCTLINHSA